MWPTISCAATATHCMCSQSEGPMWIDLREMLVIRDRNLLDSALARPKQDFACAESPEIPSLASIYTASIVQHHPFVDGNKRTGFVIGLSFLELNGYKFRATQEDAARAVLELAAGITRELDFAQFLRANSIERETG